MTWILETTCFWTDTNYQLSSNPFLILSKRRMLIDQPTLGLMIILISYPELRPGSDEHYQQQYCQNGGTCGGEHFRVNPNGCREVS